MRPNLLCSDMTGMASGEFGPHSKYDRSYRNVVSLLTERRHAVQGVTHTSITTHDMFHRKRAAAVQMKHGRTLSLRLVPRAQIIREYVERIGTRRNLNVSLM